MKVDLFNQAPIRNSFWTKKESTQDSMPCRQRPGAQMNRQKSAYPGYGEGNPEVSIRNFIFSVFVVKLTHSNEAGYRNHIVTTAKHLRFAFLKTTHDNFSDFLSPL